MIIFRIGTTGGRENGEEPLSEGHQNVTAMTVLSWVCLLWVKMKSHRTTAKVEIGINQEFPTLECAKFICFFMVKCFVFYVYIYMILYYIYGYICSFFQEELSYIALLIDQ